ncbi:MAG: transposase [Bacteroidota bacterium]
MSEKYKFNDPQGIYFITSTIVEWIDLFTRKELRHIILDSLKYCQQKKGLIIHAWCLMPSHLHMIISSDDIVLSDILRDFKKYTNKEIIKAINEIGESRRDWLLKSFSQSADRLKRIKKYKVWQDGNHPKQLLTNQFMQQKLDYIHQNPVSDEIVDHEAAYIYSSARDYCGRKGLLEIAFLD